MATLTYVPSRIGEGFFIDVPTPGSGDNAKALTYNHATGAFVYTAFDASGTAAAAVAAHVALSDPHTQYELEANNTASAILTKLLTVDGAGSGLDADLLNGQSGAAFLRASGATAGATSSRQLFTSGITTGSIRPASDSATAIQVQTASGGTGLIFDSTNFRLGFGIAPTSFLHFQRDQNASTDLLIRNANGGTAARSLLNFVADANVGVKIYALGSGYTTSGLFAANRQLIEANGSAGLYIGSSVGDVSFFAGGLGASNIGLYLTSGGLLRVGAGGGATPTALLDVSASTTARASLRIRSGTAPTTPNAGDMWFDGTNLKFYDGSATRTITWT